MALDKVLLSSEGFELLHLTSALDLPRRGLLAIGYDKKNNEKQFLSPIHCLGSWGQMLVLSTV